LEEEEEEEKEEEQLDEEELEGNVHSVDSLSSTPTGVEAPDVAGTLHETKKSFNANN